MGHPSSLFKISLAGLCLAGIFFSTSSEATNGDIRVGLNAVQSGMANAVIASPESSATIFTNPAGLSNLVMQHMRMDLGFALMNPPRSVNGVDSDSNLFFMPTGSIAFRKNPNVTLGMGFSALAGFGMDVPDAFSAAPGDQPFVTTKELLKFAPTFSRRINPKLSLGASLDIYSQSLALSTPAFTLPQNRQFGFGLTLGGLYKASDQLQFGFSYASKGDMSAHEFNTTSGQFTLDMDHPAILNLGAAWTTQGGLLIEGDIKQIYFSKVRDKVAVGRPTGYAGPVPSSLNFGWSDQTVIAIGLRKDISDKLTLRGGINHGSSPIESEDVNNNLGAAAIAETHVSIGATFHLNPQMMQNISFTHALNNSVTASTGPANKLEMDQNVLTFNMTMTF